MKILIASALYPPDVADPAPYLKELATRLSTTHSVTVLIYGAIPEAVPGVTIITIPKELPAFQRLYTFTTTLFTLAKQHDRVLMQNAPSTELPAALAALWHRKKYFLQLSDTKIHYTSWRLLIHRLAQMVIPTTLSIPLPLPKPIMHPFRPVPEDAHTAYETSWQTHLTELETALV